MYIVTYNGENIHSSDTLYFARSAFNAAIASAISGHSAMMPRLSVYEGLKKKMELEPHYDGSCTVHEHNGRVTTTSMDNAVRMVD